jgi:recombination protein RecA
MCINQLRMKMSTNPYSDPYTTPGGNAIPFHASVRIRLTGEGSQLKDAKGNVIGIKVPLKIIKNKVAPPFRNFSIEILFGRGINEYETLLDMGIDYCEENKYVERNGKRYELLGKGKSWKTFMVSTNDGEVLLEKKCTKNDFGDLFKDEAMKTLLLEFYDGVLTSVFSGVDETKETDVNPKTDEE